MAVPSILIVAPSGCTNELIAFGTPSLSCAVFIANGSDALELDVLNPIAITGPKCLKKRTILSFANTFNKPPYTKTP
ncbi:Uncharacterised protein [Streptococcus pneumoniae]|nr:Uncharacterised protein [Streptococcus pneumoniae]CJI80960.1 Uncharacterised protein [Streptococcus pneumoniae]